MSSRELFLSVSSYCNLYIYSGEGVFYTVLFPLCASPRRMFHLSSSSSNPHDHYIEQPVTVPLFYGPATIFPITARQLPVIIGSHRVNCSLMHVVQYEDSNYFPPTVNE